MFSFTRARTAWPVSVLLTCLFLAATVASPALAGDWKGQTKTEDGVTHIMSPATGTEDPVTIELEELWRVGGDTDSDDEFFGVIARITTDKEGNVYLLDSQLSEVKVFSPDGEYLRTLGREGEGPGEFRRPTDMFFLPDGNLGVLQLAPGRIIMFTAEGDPVGDHPLPQSDEGETLILINGQLMGENLCLVLNENKVGDGKVDIKRSLALIDSEGNELTRMHEEVREFAFANALIEEKVWSTFDRRWAIGADGSLYAVTQFADYEIDVWNTDGTKKAVISREFERRERTQEEIETVYSIFEAFTRNAPNATIKVSDFDQDIAAIYPRADGTLWVLNSRGQNEVPEGSLGVFDVFDSEGHFVREVTVMGEGDPQEDGYFFVEDRLYVVTGFLDAAMSAAGGGSDDAEEEDEEAMPMSIICYQVGPLKAGM